MEIKKVGVVGIGTMGHGITQVSAQAGYDVIVVDATDELLKKGMATIDKVMSRNVEKGKVTQEDKDATMARIKTSTNMKDLADRDVVVEAVFESLDLKKQIFTDLEKICRKDAILGTNTSCLSIMDIAVQTTRPEKVVGLHFFVPPQVMKLLEIVRTIATDDETIDACKKWGDSLGKSCVIAKDTPGFIVNALMNPYLLDAIRMYEAGIASAEDIDTAIKMGLNYPMGPLTLCDFAGVDIIKFVADSMYEQTKDPKWIAPVLLNKMVAAGWLGQKTGKGFYDHSK
ncbi:3-hydroxyacyl-CoA dehydrogenase family protein [Chloroflexota bacterium]